MVTWRRAQMVLLSARTAAASRRQTVRDVPHRPEGRPVLLVSLFVPPEGATAGQTGLLLRWRELWP